MARLPDELVERIKREISVERLAEARGVKLKRIGKADSRLSSQTQLFVFVVRDQYLDESGAFRELLLSKAPFLTNPSQALA